MNKESKEIVILLMTDFEFQRDSQGKGFEGEETKGPRPEYQMDHHPSSFGYRRKDERWSQER